MMRCQGILALKLKYMGLNDAMPGNPGLKHQVYKIEWHDAR